MKVHEKVFVAHRTIGPCIILYVKSHFIPFCNLRFCVMKLEYFTLN